MSDRRVPPNIPRLLRCLARHEVDFVLTGSVAVQAWGVDISVPGDLDIVPDPSRQNLERLLAALKDLDAESWPVTGRWVIDERGEREWENLPRDHPDYLQRLPPPDPSNVASFDSMYSTRWGDFDVVPSLAGTWDDLKPGARKMTVQGVDGVLVAGIADLLARLTVPRRAKDAGRVEALRRIQRERSSP